MSTVAIITTVGTNDTARLAAPLHGVRSPGVIVGTSSCEVFPAPVALWRPASSSATSSGSTAAYAQVVVLIYAGFRRRVNQRHRPD